MRRVLLLCVGLLLVTASMASADPGGPYRRTTPRGRLDDEAGGLIIGIPGGRAWGVEGGLIPLSGAGRSVRVSVDLAVTDPDVSEAFVRIAYYGRIDRRSRQLATVDSPLVRVGTDREVTVALDPPVGAVAYRIRVLGRLLPGRLISRADAIRAGPVRPGEQGSERPSVTRLLSDLW